MTNGNTRYLAVIDPTRTEQWALQKAITMASKRENTEIVALLSVYSDMDCADPAMLKNAEIRRQTLWLEDLIEQAGSAEISIQPIVEWNKDWRESICGIAASNDIDLVIKRASGRPNSLASSDRQLIRMLDSALLLVKHSPERDLKKVLVAVDFNADDESHAALNDAIIDLGRRIRGDSESVQLHAISAYPDSDKFIHPPDVARKLEIDRGQAHVRRGKAADVIPELANQIDADLVIVGNVGRRGLSGVAIGNTSEKILTDIRSDVLVLVREETRERNAA